jgi:predicted phosphatase
MWFVKLVVVGIVEYNGNGCLRVSHVTWSSQMVALQVLLLAQVLQMFDYFVVLLLLV